jgi:hypothetical protein
VCCASTNSILTSSSAMAHSRGHKLSTRSLLRSLGRSTEHLYGYSGLLGSAGPGIAASRAPTWLRCVNAIGRQQPKRTGVSFN